MCTLNVCSSADVFVVLDETHLFVCIYVYAELLCVYMECCSADVVFVVLDESHLQVLSLDIDVCSFVIIFHVHKLSYVNVHK